MNSRDANANMCVGSGIVNGGGERLYGVVDGAYVASADRVDELSNRMFARNVPSQDMQPNYDMRPVATKYTVMPIYDQYKTVSESTRSYPVYSPHNVFNPGTSRPHFNGFAANVNVESTLRNQWFALGCNLLELDQVRRKKQPTTRGAKNRGNKATKASLQRSLG